MATKTSQKQGVANAAPIALAFTVLLGAGGLNAGIDRTGAPRAFAFGSISAFGSVVVNGVRYDTANAQFLVDGQFGTQADLAIGDVVSVQGSIDVGATTGTATLVIFDDVVEGPIAAIDLSSNILTVVGQSVQVTENTSFDSTIPGGSVTELAIGDSVEVSGLVKLGSVIEATRIGRSSQANNLEVTGRVENLDSANQRFFLASQAVDYSRAQPINFPSGSISAGDRVEVKGNEFSQSGELRAQSVELKGSVLNTTGGEWLEVEGFVTDFTSTTDFEVDGIAVTTNEITIFENGLVTDLGPNLKLEVEGFVEADGTIVADLIAIRRTSVIRLEGPVDAVDSAGQSVTVMGITIRTDALTRFKDKTRKLESFSIDDIGVGDFVSARGMELPPGSGDVLAVRLRRDDPDDISIQGFVESVDSAVIRILGVDIDTSGRPKYQDVNGARLTEAGFFSLLSVGDLVKAEGSAISMRVLSADQLEFETE